MQLESWQCGWEKTCTTRMVRAQTGSFISARCPLPLTTTDFCPEKQKLKKLNRISLGGHRQEKSSFFFFPSDKKEALLIFQSCLLSPLMHRVLGADSSYCRLNESFQPPCAEWWGCAGVVHVPTCAKSKIFQTNATNITGVQFNLRNFVLFFPVDQLE